MFSSISANIKGIPGVPQYRAIADAIRQCILSGQLEHGVQLPSESQLSADFGVNNRTLRAGLKLLADEHLISQCRGKGTFVTYRSEYTTKIVVLLGDCENLENDMYLLRLVAGLSRAGEHQSGVELQFITSPSPSMLYDRLQSSACEAVIVLDRLPAIAYRLCEDDFRHLPIVFINPAISLPAASNLFDVSIAPGSTVEGIRLLHGLGHRRIGFINAYGDLDARVAKHDREFFKICEELGISSSYIRHVPVESDWFPSSREAAVSLLSGSDRPTALFCPGFIFSCGAWQGVMDLGLRIPEDVSFLGFDANKHSNPLMSSLDAPLSELATKSVEVSVAMRFEGKHRKDMSWMQPRLYMPRGSCRSILEETCKGDRHETIPQDSVGTVLHAD